MMNTRGSYHTKQKNLILACLRQYKGCHATVETIGQYLKEKGAPVSSTTLYRNLDNLVKSGAVFKYTIPKDASACYQLLEQPLDYSKYYFLVCVACGRVTPLPCDDLVETRLWLQDQHCFILDCSKTILYGYCTGCAARGNEPLRTESRLLTDHSEGA